MNNYRDRLASAIAVWESGNIAMEDEWVFEDVRRDCIDQMTPETAFDEIEFTLEVLMRCDKEDTAVELVAMLCWLAGQSDTTQVPDKLRQNKDALISRFEKYGSYSQEMLHKLFSWYRL